MLILQTKKIYLILVKCCLPKDELLEGNVWTISGTQALRYLWMTFSFLFSLGLPCYFSTILNQILNPSIFNFSCFSNKSTDFFFNPKLFNKEVLNFWVANVFCFLFLLFIFNFICIQKNVFYTLYFLQKLDLKLIWKCKDPRKATSVSKNDKLWGHKQLNRKLLWYKDKVTNRTEKVPLKQIGKYI